MYSLEEVDQIEIIAQNIAWMHNFKLVEKNDIVAAISDILLDSSLPDEYILSIYFKYVEIIGNNLKL